MSDSRKDLSGVYDSDGVYGSNGVYGSRGVSYSRDVYGSNGVSCSRGVSYSEGVYGSNGVYGSDSVSDSRGVYNSEGVYDSLFVSNYRSTRLLFNKEVTKERISEVKSNYYSLCNGWYPKFNNAFELYNKNGKKWNFDASKIKSKSKKEAWSDMPQAAIDYLRSLPEFDEKVFEEVTGIKPNAHKIWLNGKEIELSQESYENIKKQFLEDEERKNEKSKRRKYE